MRRGLIIMGGVAALLTSSGAGHAQDDSKGITIVLPNAVEVAEPCMSARSSIGIVIKQNVVETLTEIDPEDGAVTPRLATSWERLDESTWRFKIREGVKFHDGADLDADAVAYFINRTMDPSITCINRIKFFGSTELTPKVVDKYTLDITTDPVQPILPTLLGNMAIGSPNTKMGEHTRDPVGTGPYVFSEWDLERVVLDRFEDYWGDEPPVESVTYVWRDESAVRAAMVTTGEADIAPNIAVQDAIDPDTDSSYLSGETLVIMITADVPPLDDVRVRKALNLAVDREAFIGTVLSQDVLPATQFVIPMISGYNPDIKPWPYDLDEAKRLIEEARADGVPVDREILLGGTGFFPGVSELLAVLAQMWQTAGLNVRTQMIETVQYNDMRTKPYAEDRPPMLFVDPHDNTSGDAAITVFFKYHSEGGQSNLSDPELDRIIEEASAATGETRRELYQEALRQVQEDLVAHVALFHLVGYARVSPRLDFEPSVATNSEMHVQRVKFR